MKKYLILILLGLSLSLLALDPVYHSYDEIVTELNELQELYPEWAHVEVIGTSTGGAEQEPQPIYAIKISDNASVYEDEPKVMFAGQCHAEEVLGVEVAMYMANDLLEHRMMTPWQIWIQNIEIWIVPTYNPDGLNVVHSGQDDAFRKNVRDNNDNGIFDFVEGPGGDIDGTDPNRNYDFNWIHSDTLYCPNGEEIYDYYRGPYPFSAGGTQAIRDLAADNHFIYSINYHSSRTGNFSEKVYYSFEWAGGKESVDIAMTSQAGQEVANRIAVEPPQSGHYQYYPSQSRKGSAHDWFYHQHGTIQLLIECGTSNLQPGADLVLDTCERNVEGAYWMLGRVLGYQTDDKSMLTGHVLDAVTGDPLEAELVVVERDASYFAPRMTDPAFGRFFRPLEHGTYTLIFRKKGYEELTVENVVINNSGWTDLDIIIQNGIQLQPLAQVNLTGNVSCNGESLEAEIFIDDVDDDILNTDTNGNYSLSTTVGDKMVTVIADNCVPIHRIETFTEGDMTLDFILEPSIEVFSETWDNGFENWNVDGPWGIVASDNAMNFLDDSPSVFYGNNINVSVTTSSAINFNGVSSDAMLYLHHRFYTEHDVDYCVIETSTNGSDWDELKRFSGVQKTWVKDVIPVGHLVGDNAYLRFRIATDNTITDPGWKIDEIVISASTGAGTEDSDIIPAATKLIGNYPNPFNPDTEISFALGIQDDVKLLIYNVRGQLVKTLVDEELDAGFYTRRWSGTDQNNNPVSSGIYFYHFNSSTYNTAKKMILMK